MESRTPSEGVSGDPFWSAVRRDHPDVDIIVLPPPLPASPLTADPRPQASPDDVAAARVRISALADQVWASMAPGAAEQMQVRLEYGATPSEVRPTGRVGAHRRDGAEAMTRLERELHQHGWEVHRTPGPIERLTGLFEDVEITASWALVAEALTATVAGASRFVGPERSRELVRQGRSQPLGGGR